jgi:dihydroxyacid dehydratase/phosphogluconate dehydratase
MLLQHSVIYLCSCNTLWYIYALAGHAKVFDSEEDMLASLERVRDTCADEYRYEYRYDYHLRRSNLQGEITKQSVVVIRYEGPKGGPVSKRI